MIFDVRHEMMKRIRLLKNGLPLWDIRVSGDGSIWGEMVGTDKKCRVLYGTITEAQLRALSDAPSGLSPLPDDYQSNDTDVIVTVRYDGPKEENVFLLSDVQQGTLFRAHCEELIRKLIEREAEHQPEPY